MKISEIVQLGKMGYSKKDIADLAQAEIAEPEKAAEDPQIADLKKQIADLKAQIHIDAARDPIPGADKPPEEGAGSDVDSLLQVLAGMPGDPGKEADDGKK